MSDDKDRETRETYLRGALRGWRDRATRAEAERDEARAQVARVEALADALDTEDVRTYSVLVAQRLRAALAGPGEARDQAVKDGASCARCGWSAARHRSDGRLFSAQGSFIGHCEAYQSTKSPDPMPQPTDGPQYYDDLAAWKSRQGRP